MPSRAASDNCIETTDRKLQTLDYAIEKTCGELGW